MWRRRQRQEADSRLNSLAVAVPMLRGGQSRELAPRPAPRQRGASAGPASASSAFHSPAIRRGGPAQPPSQLMVILASAVARRRGRRKQERIAGASPPTGRVWASSAQPCRSRDPRRQEKYKAKKNVSWSPPGLQGRRGGLGRRGGGAAQVAGSSFYLLGPHDLFLGRSPGLLEC